MLVREKDGLSYLHKQVTEQYQKQKMYDQNRINELNKQNDQIKKQYDEI